MLDEGAARGKLHSPSTPPPSPTINYPSENPFSAIIKTVHILMQKCILKCSGIAKLIVTLNGSWYLIAWCLKSDVILKTNTNGW